MDRISGCPTFSLYCREVPQGSTGFSPFELFYGHEVKGPLSLLRDIWKGNQVGRGEVNIVSHVVEMRDRLERMSELAQSHMAEAQQRQKTWYQEDSRRRRSGGAVLALSSFH